MLCSTLGVIVVKGHDCVIESRTGLRAIQRGQSRCDEPVRCKTAALVPAPGNTLEVLCWCRNRISAVIRHRYKSICSMISAASRTNFGQRVMKSPLSSASFIPSEVLISQPSNSLHVIDPLRDLNSNPYSPVSSPKFTVFIHK
uniref:Uncharacterized protein n=1 Tax=Candidatus Methanogaster sp. ANME-2c ERB4 TaxID=2759911 RepID=A0A7G9YRE5_9EURY|nr:hypothetical protein EJMHAFHI_00003 [Methanosarcinales archaeon ANME-2c ERB4]